jgi:hypothetical protein
MSWWSVHICPDCGMSWWSVHIRDLCGCPQEAQEVDRGMGIESCEERPGPNYEPDPDLDGGE